MNHSILRGMVLAIGMATAGCDGVQIVGDHRYAVPSTYLIPRSDYPFFLPRSKKNDGFIFDLDPNAAPPKRHSVVVEDRASICATARGTAAYIARSACTDTPWRGKAWSRDGDGIFWNYSPSTSARKSAPFVSCFKMQISGHPGLCHATLPWKDHLLTIGLYDDEVPRIDQLYDRATALLTAWQQ
jgi:hypothetical protein